MLGTAARERKRVDEVSEEIKFDQARHELARDLRAGVSAMKAAALSGRYMRPGPGEMDVLAGQRDLPDGEFEFYDYGGGLNSNTLVYGRGEGGGQTVYAARVRDSSFDNVWATSIRDIARSPFRAEPLVQGWDVLLQGRDIPETEERPASRIPGWIDNFDGQGRSFATWAQESFEEALFNGISFGLVDQDPRIFPDAESRRRAGARPYCLLLRRDDIVRITLEKRPGYGVRVKQLVIRQCIEDIDTEDPNGWSETKIPSYRVFDAAYEKDGVFVPVRSRVYVKDDAQASLFEREEMRATIEPEIPGERLWDIPLVPIYGNRIGDYRGESPFLDTAEVQKTVWNMYSRMQAKTAESSTSYLHESGVQGEPQDSEAIGNNRDLRYRWSDQPGASLTFVEQSPAMLAQLLATIEWHEARIKASHNKIASEPATSSSTTSTATEVYFRYNAAATALDMWLLKATASWVQMFNLFSLLGGLSLRGTLAFSPEYGVPQAGVALATRLYEADKMCAENYFPILLQSGAVPQRGFDLNLEIARERAENALLTMAKPEERKAAEEGSEEEAGGEAAEKVGDRNESAAGETAVQAEEEK